MCAHVSEHICVKQSIHIYSHTYILAYIYTCIHTYVHICACICVICTGSRILQFARPSPFSNDMYTNTYIHTCNTTIHRNIEIYVLLHVYTYFDNMYLICAGWRIMALARPSPFSNDIYTYTHAECMDTSEHTNTCIIYNMYIISSGSRILALVRTSPYPNDIHVHIYICKIYKDIGTHKYMCYLQYVHYLCRFTNTCSRRGPRPFQTIYTCIHIYILHEKLLGITWVSNPASRKDLAARTWGVFWYYSKLPVLFVIMVQIKQKRGTGFKTPSPKSFWCGVKYMETSEHTNICIIYNMYIIFQVCEYWLSCGPRPIQTIYMYIYTYVNICKDIGTHKYMCYLQYVHYLCRFTNTGSRRGPRPFQTICICIHMYNT